MELQIVWNDVADIMESPFHDLNHSQTKTTTDENSFKYLHDWQERTSPHSIPDEAINSSDDLYPWQEDELKVNNRTIYGGIRDHTNPSEVVAGNAIGVTMATLHRKRKFWEQHENSEQDRDCSEQSDERKEQRETIKKNSGSPGTRMSSWDLAENLAADLDGSLSGLGVDLSTASYNMSEALLALPSLTVLKQEAPSPNSHIDNGLGTNSTNGVREADSNTPSFKNALQNNSQHGSATSLHQLLQSNYNNVSSTNHPTQVDTNSPDAGYQQRATKTAPASSTTTLQDLGIDCRFQYVLAAATSIATKVNEETLTYLNQGQSYEIKLKKLGELSAYRGKILKSVIRICFHERRLQYMEHEQMAAWRASRPGDRIVEVDIPLSYGIYDVIQDQWLLNTVEFLWDPTKEVGVYIKVNCISTEFTPKKHGGEKGVPFRIQVETYLQGEGSVARLHAGACQIKVFKLKGGDRKHKQDREKILKRPASEHEKFQPSYDCTVLNDIPTEFLYSAPMNSAVSSSVPVYTPTDNRVNLNRGNVTPTSSTNNLALSGNIIAKEERNGPIVPQMVALPSPDDINENIPADQQSLPPTDIPIGFHELPSDATAQQTAQWLQAHRFGAYLRIFTSFSGADVLRLSRDDLIQICGLPDGIRLYNSLHSRSIVPQLTMYLCVEQSAVYHALYLASLSSVELGTKLALLLSVSTNQIHDVYMQGPAGIHVLVTDDVVRNIKDEAMYTIEILQDQSGERYRLLLKPANHQ